MHFDRNSASQPDAITAEHGEAQRQPGATAMSPSPTPHGTPPDERWAHGFDPTTFAPLVERVNRICRVALGETPEAVLAKQLGHEQWIEDETAWLSDLVLVTIRERLDDLTAPAAGQMA